MGVSGQGDKPLSPKTQKNDDDNAIRMTIGKRRGGSRHFQVASLHLSIQSIMDLSVRFTIFPS